jgi:Tol biopolymer transport system component
MGANGQDVKSFMALDSSYEFKGPKWSPDGKRILYLKNKFGGDEGSVESRSVADGGTVQLLSGKGLRDFWWTADGRLIYAQSGISEDGTNDLWELPIDEKSGQRTNAPQRLTRWVGYTPGFISVSANGKRILTTKGYTQSDVYVADLDVNGQQMKPERRLTLDTRSDWPSGWTKDGKEILFFSDRTGSYNIYRQVTSVQDPELVVRANEDVRAARVTADGQWLLYMAWSDAKRTRPVRLMRIPPSGGSGEIVLEAKGQFASGITFSETGEQDAQMKGPKAFPDFRCPSAQTAPCLLAEAAQDEIVFTSFDPIKGRGGEAARIRTGPSKFFWDLSPDGSRLAYGEFKSVSDDHITIMTLNDRSTRDVPLTGRTALSSLSWSANGRDLFVATSHREGSEILRVGLDGKINLLREQKGRWFSDLRPSPNGGSLAFSVRTTDSNVWLLETN